MRNFIRTAFTILIIIGFTHQIDAQNYIITTVAGDSTSGYNGDSILATSAELNYAEDLAVDDSGNIYIADTYNNRIRKIDHTTGQITTIAGTGTYGYNGDSIAADTAEFRYPSGIAVDDSGNIYIADSYNQRIRRIDHITNIITTIAGTGTAGYNGDSILATNAKINYPADIVLDNSGNMYIADLINHRIRKVNLTTDTITTIAGNGTQGFSGDGGLADTAKLNRPSSVALDNSGNLYIADQFNNRVREVNLSTGIITTFAGSGTQGFSGDGGLADTAKLYYPSGLVFDSLGNLYISDDGNNRIRKVDNSTDIISTIAGNGSAGFGGDDSLADSAMLLHPYGMAIDDSSNIYFADYYNSRIRKLSINLWLNFAVNDSVICPGDSISFTNKTISYSNASYQWTFQGGTPNTSTAENPTISYASSGTYTVKLIATNTFETDSLIKSYTITVLTPPTVSISGNATFCPGTSDTLTASSGATSPMFVWNTGDSSASTVVNASGNYFVTVTDSNGCTNTDTVNVNVFMVNTTITDSSPTLIANAMGATYQWIDCNHSFASLSGETNQSFTASQNGNYAVIITDSTNGCVDTSNCVAVVNTGIERNNFENITIYPNPNKGEFTIQLGKKYTAVNIRITDLMGKLVEEKSINNTQNISLKNNIPSGEYFVHIITSDGNVIVRKLMVER